MPKSCSSQKPKSCRGSFAIPRAFYKRSENLTAYRKPGMAKLPRQVLPFQSPFPLPGLSDMRSYQASAWLDYLKLPDWEKSLQFSSHDGDETSQTSANAISRVSRAFQWRAISIHSTVIRYVPYFHTEQLSLPSPFIFHESSRKQIQAVGGSSLPCPCCHFCPDHLLPMPGDG